METDFADLQAEVDKIVNDPQRFDIKNYEKWANWSEDMNVFVAKLTKFAEQCARKADDETLKEKFTNYLMMEAVSAVEKSTKDPAAGKNWEDLHDPKLYHKCISHMDLDTRFALRKTSKKSMKLVDEAKMMLKNLKLVVSNHLQVSFFYTESKQYSITSKNVPLDMVLNALNYILRTTKYVHNFVYNDSLLSPEGHDMKRNIMMVMSRYDTLRFSLLEANIRSFSDVPAFLVANNPTIDYIILNGRDNDTYKNFLLEPNFINTSRIFLNFGAEDNNIIMAIAKTWIKWNTAAGKRVLCKGQAPLVETFASRFRSRIVSQTRYRNRYLEEVVKVVRIRTSDREKHIVLCSHEKENLRYPSQRKVCKLVHVDASDLDGEEDQEEYYVLSRNEERLLSF